jgi:hypothetical protein
MQDKLYIVRTFSLLTLTLAVYCLLWQFLCVRVSLPVYYYGRLIEVLALGLFILLFLTTPMEFESMGICVPWRVLFRSLALGGGLSLAFLLLLAAASALCGHDPVCSLRVTGDVSRATYVLVAPLQEVLAKSVMYCSLERCFEERSALMANVMSALIFSLFHVVYGLHMMLLAMALSLVTGWLFSRVRCVWGCALLHFVCGFFPACFGFG